MITIDSEMNDGLNEKCLEEQKGGVVEIQKYCFNASSRIRQV